MEEFGWYVGEKSADLFLALLGQNPFKPDVGVD